MGNFFCGGRQRLGVATLLITLVLMGVWIRSTAVKDYFALPIEVQKIIGVGTDRQSLIFYANDATADIVQTYSALPSPESASDNSSDTQIVEDREATVEYVDHVAPFQITTSCSFPDPVPLFEIPFVVTVVPLTLLSTYLLLSKPRLSKATTDAKVPNDGPRE